MAEEAARSRLGRGLKSLIGDIGDFNAETATAVPADRAAATGSDKSRPQKRVPIELLRSNPRNPRRSFAPEQLDELANSIKEHGVIQPIAVRAVPGAAGSFEIIAGERRWQAAQRAGLHEVPVVVHEVTDVQALELAIIENVQREDLNAIEEAAGYQALIDEFHYGQEEIAKTVGKSRSHVANTLRLLKLPERVKEALKAGELSAGHARTLIGHPDPERLGREIIERGLNVRQAEALAREQLAGDKATVPARKHEKLADTLALEKQVSDSLGLKVSIDYGPNGGIVHVKYRNLDQLRDVMWRLERAP